jgi:Holliday junction resolvase RusA-like endonuclease
MSDRKEISFTLEGDMPSKKNAWKSGRGRVYLPAEMERELGGLLLQLNTVRTREKLREPITAPAELFVCFYTLEEKRDTDNMLTTLQDLLQKAGIVKNDNQFYKVGAQRVLTDKAPSIVVDVIYHA